MAVSFAIYPPVSKNTRLNELGSGRDTSIFKGVVISHFQGLSSHAVSDGFPPISNIYPSKTLQCHPNNYCLYYLVL